MILYLHPLKGDGLIRRDPGYGINLIITQELPGV